MFNSIRSAAFAVSATVILVGCNLNTPPVITPVPLPVIQEPAYVQQACSVLQWAVPIAQGMISNMPAGVQSILTNAQPALAACAAGNATDAIVALATQLQQYLMAKGVRPPVGMPILRR